MRPQNWAPPRGCCQRNRNGHIPADLPSLRLRSLACPRAILPSCDRAAWQPGHPSRRVSTVQLLLPTCAGACQRRRPSPAAATLPTHHHHLSTSRQHPLTRASFATLLGNLATFPPPLGHLLLPAPTCLPAHILLHPPSTDARAPPTLAHRRTAPTAAGATPCASHAFAAACSSVCANACAPPPSAPHFPWLSAGFCFVYYKDKRDAEDCIHALDGWVRAGPMRCWGRRPASLAGVMACLLVAAGAGCRPRDVHAGAVPALA